MNIIIKSDEQKRAIETILRDFGHGANASSEQREAAETIAQKTNELIKGGCRHD